MGREAVFNGRVGADVTRTSGGRGTQNEQGAWAHGWCYKYTERVGGISTPHEVITEVHTNENIL